MGKNPIPSQCQKDSFLKPYWVIVLIINFLSMFMLLKVLKKGNFLKSRIEKNKTFKTGFDCTLLSMLLDHLKTKNKNNNLSILIFFLMFLS